MAPTSARNCASASAARNGATQAATQRSQRSTSTCRRRARAKASTEATSTGSSSAPASSEITQPGKHLAHGLDIALGAVLRARALVHRGERPQRRPPEHSEAVLVDRLDGAVAVRRQLPAAGDPDGVVALLEQHALRPDADRERQPGELADACRCPRPSRRPPRGSSWPPCAAARCRRGASRSTTPGAGTAARMRAEVGDHEHGVHELRRRKVRDQLPGAHLAEVRSVHRRKHQRLLRRPSLVDARQLHQRGGVGGAARRVRDAARVARGHDHDLRDASSLRAARSRSRGRAPRA